MAEQRRIQNIYFCFLSEWVQVCATPCTVGTRAMPNKALYLLFYGETEAEPLLFLLLIYLTHKF